MNSHEDHLNYIQINLFKSVNLYYISNRLHGYSFNDFELGSYLYLSFKIVSINYGLFFSLVERTLRNKNYVK